MSILEEVQCYLHLTKMPESRFGRLAVNDPKLIRDLKAGRVTGVRMTARIRAFLAAPPPCGPHRRHKRSSNAG